MSRQSSYSEKDVQRVAKMIRSGKTNAEIAEKLGCSVGCVTGLAKRAGIVRPRGRPAKGN